MRHWHAAGIRPTLRCSSVCCPSQHRYFARQPRLSSDRTSPSDDASPEPRNSEADSSNATGTHENATDAVKAALRKSLGSRFARVFQSEAHESDLSTHETSKSNSPGDGATSIADFYKQRNASGSKPAKQAPSSDSTIEASPEGRRQKPRTRKERLRIRKQPSDRVPESLKTQSTKQKSQSAADIRWVKPATDSRKVKIEQNEEKAATFNKQTSSDGQKVGEEGSSKTESEDVEHVSAPVAEEKLVRTVFAKRREVEKESSDPNSGVARRRRRKEKRRKLAEAHAKSKPTAHRRAAAENATNTSSEKDASPSRSPPWDPSLKDNRPLSLKDALMSKPLEQAVEEDGPMLGRKAGTKIETVKASDCEFTPLPIDQPAVPSLNYGLDRVLFNRGVYQLQDPYSMVYNFDPYLQKIMPVTEFDYNALKEYKTSSQDGLLSGIAREHDKKYVGSTSSMTGSLGHFHYLLSNWRPLNFSMLSREFEKPLETFTEINRAPNAMFLRWKNGTYAIDADKEFDGANVLMLLGKSLEKLLTMNTSDFERYRKSDPREVPEEERESPESFHYSTQGDFLMRSQLDAYDPRLPGTGTFDLKTRAVVSVRMQSKDYEEMSGYELHKQFGKFESYEREYYDMVRSTMLKYSLQARMGRMDGIFVAYHNVKRIFGFQYLNLSEMDRALHGQEDRCLGNQEFNLSIELFNQILNKATEKFPNQSIRFHFETRASNVVPFMYVFAEPMSEEDIDEIQNSQKEKVAEYERSIMGMAPKEESSAASAEEISPNSVAAEDSTAETKERTVEVTEQPDEPTEAHSEAPREFSAEALQATSDRSLENADIQQPQSVQPFGTSESSTDRKFLSSQRNKLEEEEKSYKPLLAMTLTIRSRVNGDYVARPERLRVEDEWKVEYALAEIPKQARAWALYEATKARRKKVFDRANGDVKEGEDEEPRPAKHNDMYIDMLREFARKGRKLRDNIDLMELDREKVVVGQPYGKVEKKAQQAEQTDS